MIPGPKRILSLGLTVIMVIVIGAIGFLVVDTVLSVRNSVDAALPGNLGESVREAINTTPTIFADPVTVILEIRALARLETASYTIEKIITAESGEGPLGFLIRDKLLLVAHGEVIAGVDLSKMTEDDVIVSGTEVFVTLPAAEIFIATLDNDQTYVYDRQTALLGQQVNLETLARQAAEEQIEMAALEDGILQKAQENAEAYLGSLLMGLGFEEVSFITGTPMPSSR